jgi:hypothetical protein
MVQVSHKLLYLKYFLYCIKIKINHLKVLGHDEEFNFLTEMGSQELFIFAKMFEFYLVSQTL